MQFQAEEEPESKACELDSLAIVAKPNYVSSGQNIKGSQIRKLVV